MKHKNALRSTLLGAAALTLVACGEAQEEILAYEDVQACIKAGQQEESVCRTEFDKAEKLHEKVAPRYNSVRDCNSDFGYDRCYRSHSSGGSFWLPFMVGYMLAPRLGPRYISSQPLYRPSSNPNSFYTAANGRVGPVSTTGRTQLAASQVKQPAARTRTVARGGFGARAASRRSAGG